MGSSSAGGGDNLQTIAGAGVNAVKFANAASNLYGNLPLGGASSITGPATLIGPLMGGLKAAGIDMGEAPQVIGNIVSQLASITPLMNAPAAIGAIAGVAPEAISALGAITPALTAAEIASSLVGSVGAVAAPFIAMGMHAIEEGMKPNFRPLERQMNARIHEAVSKPLNAFNDLSGQAASHGYDDPEGLLKLMQAGDTSLNNWNTASYGGGGNVVGRQFTSSNSGYIGGFPTEIQAQLVQPYVQGLENLDAIDKMTGGKYESPNWTYYLLHPQGLDTSKLAQGTYDPAIAYALGVTPYTPGSGIQMRDPTMDELKAASGGVGPVQWEIQKFKDAMGPAWKPVDPWGAVPDYATPTIPNVQQPAYVPYQPDWQTLGMNP